MWLGALCGAGRKAEAALVPEQKPAQAVRTANAHFRIGFDSRDGSLVELTDAYRLGGDSAP